jgi:hypothetical protein
VNALASAALGAPASTRRCLLPSTADDGTRQRSYLMDIDPPAELPAGLAWLPVGEALAALPDRERELLAGWLAWERAPDPRRVAWYAPGWLPRARGWLEQRAGPVERLRQLRCWQRSAVLSAETSGGALFLKASPPHFAHELPLAAWLAARFPELAPPALAADAGEGLLLLGGVPGAPLDAAPDPARLAVALRRYAELQVATVPHAAELRALGLPDRGGGWLAEGLGPLLADREALLVGRPGGLGEDELAALREREGLLRERCAELATSQLPPALEHGDFGAWQVLDDGERTTILDWSDSAVADPLWSLASFLLDLPAEVEREPLVEAYLGPWEALAPPALLRRAWALTEVLYGIYNAQIYQREIMPHTELAWESERMVPMFARLALSAVA